MPPIDMGNCPVVSLSDIHGFLTVASSEGVPIITVRGTRRSGIRGGPGGARDEGRGYWRGKFVSYFPAVCLSHHLGPPCLLVARLIDSV